MPKLTNVQIAQKLQEGRNYKRLYFELKGSFDEVKAENKALRADNQELKEVVASLKIQVAELQAMVFGKKKRPPTATPPQDSSGSSSQPPRTKDSYKRALPSAESVTATVSVTVSHCACGGELTGITEHGRYVEDLPLPELTTNYQSKLVTKYLVERGICTKCGKPTSGQDLGGAIVSLGPNVRLLVCHLVAGLGMSYAQVANLLLSLYGLTVTDGELANILRKQHSKWQPTYQQLLSDIRGSPVVHADETPWPIQDLQGYGYAWNISDALSPKVCFALENSRGVCHAKDLFGDQFRGVRISDDYSAYRTLPGSQQLCWAHLYRAIRDLRYNDNLPEEQLPYVTWWYEQFAGIYEDLRIYLHEPYDEIVRQTQSNELWERVQTLVGTVGDRVEPAKLTRLKAQLLRAGQNKLFICLPKDTPCDNNRAERDLRQLVLKRKRSFGSKSEKGAQALATVLSICTTNWRTNQNNYFSTLAALA